MIRTLAIIVSALLWSTQVLALTVNDQGDVVCGTGKQEVYWQEDNGLDPKYRDIVVIDYERFQGVLVYQEHQSRSMVLENATAGTNIPWRLLAMPDGESYGTLRSLPVDTSLLTGGVTGDYRGRTVHVLIIGANHYWPVCAFTSAVDEWFENAEVPEWHKVVD